MSSSRICLMPGCQAEVHARSLCHTHYMRDRRHGSPTAIKRPADWGSRDKHPLYERWKSMSRLAGKAIDPAWKDFWQFVQDVGQPPSELHRLYRINAKGLWSKENTEWRERLIVHGQATREAKAKYMREYYARSPHVLKRGYLKKHYGITLERYNEIYDSQKGLCAICERPERRIYHKTGEPFLLAVDHCHKTGKIRGLLCSYCNHGLGNFEDDTNRLESAIAYLKSHQ